MPNSSDTHKAVNGIPILLGVIFGTCAWFFVAQFGSPPYYSVTSWVLNEKTPIILGHLPNYPLVIGGIGLAFASAGGLIGIRFSKLSLTHSMLYLLGLLAILAVIFFIWAY